VCDLETSRMGAPYIYDISHLRVKQSHIPSILGLLLATKTAKITAQQLQEAQSFFTS